MVYEERLAGAALNVLFKEFRALLEEHQVNLFVIEIISNHAATAIVGVRMLRQLTFVQEFCRRNRNPVAR